MAKALAVRPSKALTVPKKSLATVPKTDTQLATARPGGVVATGTAYDPKGPMSSQGDSPARYPPRSEDARLPDGGLKGLVRASDAVAAGADPSAIQAMILSWGGKRKYQALADGGRVQRRTGGAGYGGSGSGGQLPPGRKGKGAKIGKDVVKSLPNSPAEVPYKGTAKGPSLALPDKSKPLALGNKPQPLALGDKPRPAAAAEPLPRGGMKANGPAPQPQAPKATRELPAVARPSVGEVQPDQVPIASTVAAVADAAVWAGKTILDDSFEKNNPVEVRDRAKKLRLADVRAQLKNLNFSAALNLVLADPNNWVSAAQQDLAADAVEKALKKRK